MRCTSLASTAVIVCLAAAAGAAASPVTLVGTIRDFNADFQDFEGGVTGVRTGLLSPTLSAGAAPTLNTAPGGWTPGAGGITSHESFARWYSPGHDPAASTLFAITLSPTATPGVVRYSNNAFFPIDNQLLGNEGRGHNYHFTYEVRTSFVYEPGQFVRAGGDDDVWLYIDGRLAIDVGGVRPNSGGSFDLDGFGLIPGETYSFDLFYAERRTSRAELWIETNITSFDSALIPLPGAGALGLAGLGLLATRRRRALA